MIPMQRSLSSPVRIHRSSDFTSPIVTKPLKSPTPPPETHVESHAEKSRPSRRPSSPRPGRDREPAFANTGRISMRSSEDSPRRASTQQTPSQISSRKPVIAQSTPPLVSTPQKLPESSVSIEDGGRSSPLPSKPLFVHGPLIQDASLYTNPHLQLEEEIESTTLEELAHLVRLSRYQERKRANTRIRLQRSLVSTALSVRFTRCGEIAHRNLAESFRGDDKKTFASLYGALQDVRKSCDEMRRYALLEPEIDPLRSPGAMSSESLDTPTGSVAGSSPIVGSLSPFLNDISASARDTFLGFLTQIRNNPEYLATRLCSLTASERAAITSYHQGLEPVESVLPYYSRASGRGGASSNRNSASVQNPVERLLSFQRHDPLSALIHTCFANSAGPDSAEDKRRTDIWATACARMISDAGSAKSGHEAVPVEPILISVLNVWAAMRDWSGRTNMEWYLMKILEDGAFLLDRAEDQHGTRFNISDWTAKDQIAAEEFYERAIEELFDTIDDEDATGIPEGLIELGNHILKRLEHRYVDSTRKWFVYKWLFSVWLVGVIIHPESHGMMTEYHITEYGRQKILKQVAMKASSLAIDMLYSKEPVSTPPKVKTHIESILARFKSSRSSKPRHRLLPARSITSLRETAEVHPYLVVSPADLVTMVNALFPEKRPLSAHSSSQRSGAMSISGMSAASQPISVVAPSNYDTASVVSTSFSSTLSDTTTSREPLLEQQSSGATSRHSPPIGEDVSQGRASNYEDDGYRLRLAIHEMTQTLGPEAVRGTCHPCAERWAVLFISADGNSLSTQMTFDPDDDPEEENSSSLNETDEEEPEEERPELDKDYHQLRDSILKLVEEFEIPRSIEPGGPKQTFSNRASSLKKYRSKNKVITTEKTLQSRNPYRHKDAEQTKKQPDDTDGASSPQSAKGKETDGPQPEPTPVLVAMLTAASSQSRAQSDFVSAHLYWRTVQQLNALSSPSLRAHGFATLLNIFSRGPRDSIRRSASAIEEYDAWLVWLKQSQERAEGLLDSMMRRLRALRDKMWYVTDVRNSAPYEYSRNIAVALKTMGMPQKWSKYQRVRAHLARGPSANYLYRTESQIVDLLAASEDQGGPNKLSDDQAEKTSRWLHDYGIENFCRGEERIHRFCCEIEACIGKLVADNMLDGPVLWSSELYFRDRRQFEGGRRDRDSAHFVIDDTSSIISDPERRFTPASSRPGSVVRDLRAITAHNSSSHSFDSQRFSFSRASTALSDILDGAEYVGGVSSPAPTIDTATTYWSPFRASTSPSSPTSRAHSPTTSITNLSAPFSVHGQIPSQSHYSTGRPGTAASSVNETVYQQRLAEEKGKFLDELRQSLTSLLLSDLGNLVFARGSETDGWFDSLGQECIDRRQAAERKARQALRAKKTRVTKKDTQQRIVEKDAKQRVIAKKKSSGDLRGTGGGTESLNGSERQAPAPSTLEVPRVGGNESSATSDTISARSNTTVRRDSTPEFPFTKAYQRLLRMFCVHPNPYMKLNALFELQHLIMASLSSRGSRHRLGLSARSSNTGLEGSSSTPKRAKLLDEAIDNVKERRSHSLQSPSGQSPRFSGGGANPDTKSIVGGSSSAANTDAVADVLQSLFRDPAMRPKTLFRDLQFIASFVPASLLDRTERGKAFWDCGLAALSLKQEVCRTMVEVADEVVGVHTQTRKASAPAASRAPSTDADSNSGISITESRHSARDASGQGAVNSQGPPTPPPPTTAYTFADAARMLTITAKEGDPTSQRELALFYLANPELVERTTLPLSRPREVFKQAVMEKYGGGSSTAGSAAGRHHGAYHERGMAAGGGGGAAGAGGRSGGAGGVAGGAGAAGGKGAGPGAGGDPRNDPALMCVAVHWMEAAERGGDEVARTFLRQNEFVGGG
ncbi:chromatin assembly factor 1 subunit rlf2 protein [Pleurostoma richardsiae]|uniref:Chromatin assembly factor 1 subunit rlf2 protein n=1 Tax=Pleurostoma richardsiae TaxID=41990 RepID=A0AA38RDA3_9PEZI|nr:chromatin assembly factor 1 subunit rlf2 protein [Pleurostoma richardsiae]